MRSSISRRVLLVVAVAALVWGSSAPVGAQPAPRVLVLPVDGEVRPSLLEVLRIQLTGAASVELGAPAPAHGFADNLQHASDELVRADAALAVWVEIVAADGAPERAILYVVGRQRDLALVRVARVTGPSRTELERTLALTIAELLDSVLALQRGDERDAPALVQRLARAPAPPEETASSVPAVALESAPAAGPWGVSLELGGAVLIGTATPTVAVAARGALMLRYDLGGAWIEAGAAAQLPSTVDVEQEGARVELREVDAAGTLRVLARAHALLAVGGALDLGVRWLDARGIGRDGREGSRERVIPTASLAADARLTITPSVEIRAAIGVELGFLDQRFTVDGEPVLDVGVARPTFGLSLVLSAM